MEMRAYTQNPDFHELQQKIAAAEDIRPHMPKVNIILPLENILILD